MSSESVWVSYFPCLLNFPGRELEREKTKILFASQEDLGNILAVGWVEDVLVLFVKNAIAVSDHFNDWLVDSLSSDSFLLVWEMKKSGHYSIALMPNVGEKKDVFFWTWLFNSKNSSSSGKKIKSSGFQKIMFSDLDSQEVNQVFTVPVARWSMIPETDPMKKFYRTRLFQ